MYLHVPGNIIGITKRNPFEYVVGTLSGHLECIRIKIDANKITLNAERERQPNGHSKYALYGVASSMNNAFLLCAYFAGRVSIKSIFFRTFHFLSFLFFTSNKKGVSNT